MLFFFFSQGESCHLRHLRVPCAFYDFFARSIKKSNGVLVGITSTLSSNDIIAVLVISVHTIESISICVPG